MKNKRVFTFVFVVLFASVLGVSMGVSSGQIKTPPSWIGTPPVLSDDVVHAVNLAAMYGSSSDILANAPVTPADLESLGINAPEWANGAPGEMRLIATGGSYSVPVMTNDGTSKRMAGTMVIQVIDAATQIPTVTIVASGDEAKALIDRINAWTTKR